MTWIEERDGTRTLRLRLYDPDDVGIVLSAGQADFLAALLVAFLPDAEDERRHRQIILRALAVAKAKQDRWDRVEPVPKGGQPLPHEAGT